MKRYFSIYLAHKREPFDFGKSPLWPSRHWRVDACNSEGVQRN